MSQSSAIAGSLLIAFFVFITVRGELPYYLAVFSGTSPVAKATPGTGDAGTTAGNSAFAPPTQAGIPDWGRIPPPWGNDPWQHDPLLPL